MKKIKFIFFVLLFGSLFIYWGCKDSITADQIDNLVIPDSNVSYSRDLQPVFNLHCTNCHGNGQIDGGISLTSWSNTTADPSVVFPGYPNNSILVWSIQAKPNVSPMPPMDSPYKPLNANQVNGVITWIKEGAKNN